METEDVLEESFVIIPQEKLTQEALFGLIDEFILREGTDYGHAEQNLDQKREKVIFQLNSGHVQIFFSSKTEDCTLLRKEN